MAAEVIIDTSPNENALKYTVVGKQVIERDIKPTARLKKLAIAQWPRRYLALKA